MGKALEKALLALVKLTPPIWAETFGLQAKAGWRRWLHSGCNSRAGYMAGPHVAKSQLSVLP